MGEHVVLFERTEFPYPGSRDGKLPVPEGGGMLDTVATFGFLAAATKRIRFGTGIALISQRNPIYTAKEFATLDWLSNGRIDFGIGVGWCKEEVLASGYTWNDRGARSDEFLELVKRLWTQPVASYHGEHFQLAECRLDPKPVQKPHLPILVGGPQRRGAASRRALRFRLVRLRDRPGTDRAGTAASGQGACRRRPFPQRVRNRHHAAVSRQRRHAARASRTWASIASCRSSAHKRRKPSPPN